MKVTVCILLVLLFVALASAFRRYPYGNKFNRRYNPGFRRRYNNGFRGGNKGGYRGRYRGGRFYRPTINKASATADGASFSNRGFASGSADGSATSAGGTAASTGNVDTFSSPFANVARATSSNIARGGLFASTSSRASAVAGGHF